MKHCSAPGADIPLLAALLGPGLFVFHDSTLSVEGAQAPSGAAGSREAAALSASSQNIDPVCDSDSVALAGTWTAGSGALACGTAAQLQRGHWIGFYTDSLSQTQQKPGSDYSAKELLVFHPSLSRQVL